ncbi:aspartate--ammonia ligase [Oceanivirga salmonicida]|uniref:aspartate--ammonia ligase n=1 Tax=Oceanivirga salmonicida TaxID=1769291 RepID=UPI00082CCD6C|nr:aspartate--ammonia ligase [Oceanivirga salmonicida]
MKKTYIPKEYKPMFCILDMEIAIKQIKDFFEKELSRTLNLTRISAPLFVERKTGLNDNLNGIERPVSFDMLESPEKTIEIVHSLAKWKRYALKRYGFKTYEGIYTDMNAIRRDEELDNIHSIYVDQWDWEKIITKEDRNVEYLKDTVRKIYKVFLRTEKKLQILYDNYEEFLAKDIHFITSQELLDKYPNLSSKEREYEICKKYGTVFIMQIGDLLSNKEKHDGRAPDYDDWSLNGDILVYNKVLDIAFELSSMGVRVDKKALESQLVKANVTNKTNFHNMLLNDELPLTIGGGIGQSRICMLFLKTAHIGEVQASMWSEEIEKDCRDNGINLL